MHDVIPRTSGFPVLSLADIIAFLRLLRTFIASASPIVAAVRGPILTVLLSMAMLIMAASLRQGGLYAGLTLLFGPLHHSDMLQRELRNVARRDETIDQLLEAILLKAPGAARVRLAIIHNGEMGLTGVGLLRFDVTHAVVAQGYSAGRMVINGPLSDWSPYLTRLLMGECSQAGLEGMSAAERTRMIELGVSERLACPVTDIQGRLLGGVFVTWPTGATVPDDADIRTLSDYMRHIAAQIAVLILATGQ